MKKYMVVCQVENETTAAFFDDINKADSYRMDASCGLGGYAEVYERVDTGEGMAYELVYA